MSEGTPQTIHLKDYQPCPYTINDVHLTFSLHSSATNVISKMTVKREASSGESLVLNGEELEFISAKVNGENWGGDSLQVTEDGLILKDLPAEFELEIENKINPEANKALDGLYKSGPIFCTQNEPEGFRRITYYLDRPDVMAKFTTKVIADKEQYPVVLSNGNPIGEGEFEDGRHWVEWQDPFPKPCYLYALVAGDLGLVSDTYKTMSGRTIDLRVYCDKGNESRCGHAMESLKKSMKWDEETFGLEYDLDIYMIVAVDSFNMGAMENKGLNIFNSVYVLADESTATDGNFLGIESVVGHEYFHNWTGNRITCRDWFQLTLKEGLTVYRDQEFSSDLNSRTVQRIQDVERLRTVQFVEDGGPTAHPIKPDSYIEINNFYTATIYEKGAEVIRMVRTFLGVDGFRRGMDKYFELFDGQAVTTEDFLHAMSVANGDFDFSQFKNWYSQAGTPNLKASWDYNESHKTLTLKLAQSCKPTPGQKEKKPFHFPFAVGLLNDLGEDMTLKLESSEQMSEQTDLDKGFLHITKPEETFVFTGVNQKPAVSLNRSFSAPIHLESDHKLEDFFFLMANDTDLFNRYEAFQSASLSLVENLLVEEDSAWTVDAGFSNAFGKILEDDVEPAVKAMLMAFPSATIIGQGQNPVDYIRINKVRDFVKKTLAGNHKEALLNIYKENGEKGEYKLDPISVGKRSLRARIIGFLIASGDEDIQKLSESHFSDSTNMTEELGGLSLLSQVGGDAWERASNTFYKKWEKNTLVMQKWLTVAASGEGDETFERVKTLESDEVYDVNVPNLVRSLLGGFSRNLNQLHHESGRGYKFIADKVIEVDSINPQVASRLASVFKDYKRLKPQMKELMKVELERILAKKDISKNVFEIASKIVKDS